MIRGFPTFFAGLIASAIVFAASAASAFTIENGDASTTSGGNLMAPSPFNDPAKRDTDKDGGTRTQFGGSSVYFGPARSSPDADYQTGINRMFSPLGRPPN